MGAYGLRCWTRVGAGGRMCDAVVDEGRGNWVHVGRTNGVRGAQRGSREGKERATGIMGTQLGHIPELAQGSRE